VRLQDVEFYDDIVKIWGKINNLDFDLNADILAVEKREYKDPDFNSVVEYEIVFKNTPCIAIVLKKRVYKSGEESYWGFISHTCGE